MRNLTHGFGSSWLKAFGVGFRTGSGQKFRCKGGVGQAFGPRAKDGRSLKGFVH